MADNSAVERKHLYAAWLLLIAAIAVPAFLAYPDQNPGLALISLLGLLPLGLLLVVSSALMSVLASSTQRVRRGVLVSGIILTVGSLCSYYLFGCIRAGCAA